MNLPSHPFKIKQSGEKHHIFDELRKKYLQLTPEEWVRQHFIQYLIQHKNYPKGLIAIETGLKVNGLRKRADVLIFNKNGEVLAVIECKAATIKITTETFNQAARYNIHYKAPFLMVTNGLEHFCSKVFLEEKRFEHLPEIPNYDELLS